MARQLPFARMARVRNLRRRVLLGVGVAAAISAMSPLGALAQEATVADALQSLAQRASAVFSGQVVEVRPVAGVVQITFRVDAAVKGVSGGTYVLREWNGLWAAGQRRYWVGERALMFLRGASDARGLGSSVDGMEGVLPLLAAASSAGPRFDVARLRTRLLRAVGAPMADDSAGVSVEDVRRIVAPVRWLPPASWAPVSGQPRPPLRTSTAPPPMEEPPPALKASAR